jgi:thioredoxin reductase
MFDVLIIGGGVSGISCALVLGSAKIKIADKGLAFSPIKIIITTGSCFNAYGIPAGSLGSDLCKAPNTYPNST